MDSEASDWFDPGLTRPTQAFGVGKFHVSILMPY